MISRHLNHRTGYECIVGKEIIISKINGSHGILDILTA